MTEMPRIEAGRRERVIDYALGMIHETLWILALALLALLMAVGSVWLFGVLR